MVVADADVWIDFLNGISTKEAAALSTLIHGGDILLAGIVVAELTRGAQTDDERKNLDELLSGVPYVEVSREVWRAAGHVARELDSRGQPLAFADVVLATIALSGDHELLTRDKHFDRIPGLRIYQPKGGSDA